MIDNIDISLIICLVIWAFVNVINGGLVNYLFALSQVGFAITKLLGINESKEGGK